MIEPMVDTGTEPAATRRTALGGWWLSAALLVLFALTWWQVAAHGPVTRWDVHVRRYVLAWADSSQWHWAYHPARGACDLANPDPATAVLGVATLAATYFTRRWWPLITAVSAGAFLLIVIPLLKVVVARPGPGQATLGNARLGFFPSGHTATAMLCYGTALLLVNRLVASRAARRAIAVVTVVLIATIASALIWCDFHWLSDVLGSAFLCGAVLYVLNVFSIPRRTGDG